MIVSIDKRTNRIIEAQSSPSNGTLEQNAINAGFYLEDIEIKSVSDEEFTELLMAPSVDSVRQKRDSLLYKSDWTQLPDSGLTDINVSMWKEYRQLLRDIPQQDGFPNNVTWPEEPK